MEFGKWEVAGYAFMALSVGDDKETSGGQCDDCTVQCLAKLKLGELQERIVAETGKHER